MVDDAKRSLTPGMSGDGAANHADRTQICKTEQTAIGGFVEWRVVLRLPASEVSASRFCRQRERSSKFTRPSSATWHTAMVRTKDTVGRTARARAAERIKASGACMAAQQAHPACGATACGRA